MNLNPKLTGIKSDNVSQVISVFTEQSWKTAKENYPDALSNFFSGKKNEAFIRVNNGIAEFLVGMGSDEVKDFEIQRTAQKFSLNYKKNFQPVPTEFTANFTESQLEAFVKGLYLGTYRYPFLADHPVWQNEFQLEVPNIKEETLSKIADSVAALCEGQFTCMDWLNRPANEKTSEIFSEFLKKLASEKNFEIEIFNREQCKEMGLGAFSAVNQGSAHEAAFTVLKYNSSAQDAKTIGLVGKCVLFDTGGISLKDPLNMHYMKSDMGGATAVIGTMIAAAEMQLPVNIVAVLPITDNAISAQACLPSDVVTAYNGKTIEIRDTDAEGRLTLADALAYLSKNYQTDYLLDLATLTGSAVRMFGDTCGAMFSNDAALRDLLISSGDETDQRLWNLPLWDVWDDEIQSDVADLKHMSMKPVGDCIVAAKFLSHFINDHPAWAHLDIAAMTFSNVGYAKEKAATGYGVELLLNFIKKVI